MRFVVYAPGHYTPNGGGCIALHKLAHNIAQCGGESFIFTDSKNPNYSGTVLSYAQAKELGESGAWVIYPEVICGNPLNANNVIRWVLYHVRNYDCFGLWGENDLIFKYAPMFELREDRPVLGELRAMELNLDVFKDHGKERNGTCYMLRKMGHKQPIHPKDSIFLDSYAEAGGNEYLSMVFNKSKMFYSYDSATWCSIMAALCGCISVVIPDAGVTAEQWYERFPYFRYGIAYGSESDQIAHALNTRHLLRDHLLKLEAETIELTREMIRICETHTA